MADQPGLIHRLSITGYLLITLACGTGTAGATDNGEIIAQQLDGQGRGYTVLRIWGSDYEMGFAHAELLGDHIVQGVNETEAYLGFSSYNYVREVMSGAIWEPAGMEDEINGLVDCLAITHPGESIDALDLKVTFTAGEWLYACRSHSCWGRYVTPPVKTLSTRRLDFSTIIPSMNHHVICARQPSDGSPQWINIAFPGFVTAATGVNEFGTIVSLHDFETATDLAAGRMPRMIACRHALTFATDPDPSTHLDSVFAELQNYEIMTGSFINYHAPEGYGGVLVCHPYESGSDFYYLREPRSEWHHGEAIMTSNAWTDGTYTPIDASPFFDIYYNDETPKTLASHWDLLASSRGLQQLSVAYRNRGDITIWVDGRIDGGGSTPRLEYEWSDLFGGATSASSSTSGSGLEALFSTALSISPNPFNPTVQISFQSRDLTGATAEIFDLRGRLVTSIALGSLDSGRHQVQWDGRDGNGRDMSSGVYLVQVRAGEGVSPVGKAVLIR
jgi:hypothetical protein